MAHFSGPPLPICESRAVLYIHFHLALSALTLSVRIQLWTGISEMHHEGTRHLLKILEMSPCPCSNNSYTSSPSYSLFHIERSERPYFPLLRSHGKHFLGAKCLLKHFGLCKGTKWHYLWGFGLQGPPGKILYMLKRKCSYWSQVYVF